MESLEALNDLKWNTVPADISIGHQIKCEETIKKDLEILETFRKILKENHNAQRIDNCVFAKSDTETFFGLGDDTIIVKNEDVEKIEHWFYEGERE